MIKECKVISYNKYMNILVFEYDGKQIQTTHALSSNESVVYVKFEKGIYTIVNKDVFEKSKKKNVKKEMFIEDTVEKSVKDE